MSRLFAGLPTGRYSRSMSRPVSPLFLPPARAILLGLAMLVVVGAGSHRAMATVGQSAFFTVDDSLRAEPSPSAAVVLRLKAGQAVTLGERRGFWRRVETATGAAGATGWVRLSTLRLPNAKPAPGLAALGTGREASGNVALVSGARSVAGRGALVQAATLRAAKPDTAVAGATVAAQGATTAATERELAAQIFGLAPPLGDSAVQRYVAEVGNALARTAAATPTKSAPNWRFVLLDTPSLIAFALPDGLVLISRGLFAELASEDELAALLAREMVHVKERHHWRALRSPALETYLRPLAAELEFRADAEGMRLAAAAGYDASALIAALERIDAATAAGRDTLLLRALLPSVSDRIATLAAAATPALERAAVPSALAPRIREFNLGSPGVRER